MVVNPLRLAKGIDIRVAIRNYMSKKQQNTRLFCLGEFM